MAVPGKIYADINRAQSSGLSPTSLVATGISQDGDSEITDDNVDNLVTILQANSGAGTVSTTVEDEIEVTTADLSGYIDNISLTSPLTLTPDLTPIPVVTPVTSLSFEPDQSLLDDTEPTPPPPPPPPARAVMNIYGDMARSAGTGTP